MGWDNSKGITPSSSLSNIKHVFQHLFQHFEWHTILCITCKQWRGSPKECVRHFVHQSDGEIMTVGMLCWNVDRYTNRQCAGPLTTENTISEARIKNKNSGRTPDFVNQHQQKVSRWGNHFKMMVVVILCKRISSFFVWNWVFQSYNLKQTWSDDGKNVLFVFFFYLSWPQHLIWELLCIGSEMTSVALTLTIRSCTPKYIFHHSWEINHQICSCK